MGWVMFDDSIKLGLFRTIGLGMAWAGISLHIKWAGGWHWVAHNWFFSRPWWLRFVWLGTYFFTYYTGLDER